MWLRSSHSGIALDIGPASVALCQLKRVRGGIGLARWGVVEDPLRDRPSTDQSRCVAAERAGRIARQAGFRGRRAIIALKPPDVAFHAAAMPDTFFTIPRAQRETMLRFEAARQMQATPEELEVDFWRLPPGNLAGHNVMIAAAQRGVVTDWVRMFAQVGLEVSLVDALPCALVRGAWRVGLPADGRRGDRPLLWGADRPANECLWGVLDIGFSGALLAVALGSRCVYVRTMTVGGDALSTAIESAVRVDYGTAETLKRQYRPPALHASGRPARRPAVTEPRPTRDSADTVEPGPAEPGSNGRHGDQPLHPDGPHRDRPLHEIAGTLHTLVRTRLRSLAADTERAFAYAMQSYPAATPVGLYLCGGGAKLAGLPEMLSEWLGIETRLLNSCEGVLWTADGTSAATVSALDLPAATHAAQAGGPPVQEAHYPNMAACVGLAIREVA